MKKPLDLSKEYGIVLEGGGAKGAYQIGVWKALLEYGVKIKGVAGVSVGALNGAFIAMGDYSVAEKVWENISCNKVMDLGNEHVEKLISGNTKDLDVAKVTKEGVRIIRTGGIDITPLEKLIDEYIDEEKIRNSAIEFVLGTFSLTNFKEMDVTAAEVQGGTLKEFLMASSRLPIFKLQKIHGKSYLDGGVINRVPVDLLLEKGYKDIIVIRIFGLGLEKKIQVPKDVQVIEVVPKKNLGSILGFDCEICKRNIKTGYYDGIRCILGLEGKWYYIDNTGIEETDYLARLIGINKVAKMALIEWYKEDFQKESQYNRLLFEKVFPLMAQELKLDKEWKYSDLYLGLLELAARHVKVPRYRTYTENQLYQCIMLKYETIQKEGMELPLFAEIIIKALLL